MRVINAAQAAAVAFGIVVLPTFNTQALADDYGKRIGSEMGKAMSGAPTSTHDMPNVGATAGIGDRGLDYFFGPK